MAPRFFAKAADFRLWLEWYSTRTGELVVGFYKVGWGRPSMNWPDSVDEAHCCGWSAVNVAKAERLIAACAEGTRL